MHLYRFACAPLLLYFIYFYLTNMFLALVGLFYIIYVGFYLICTLIFDCDIALGFAEKFGKRISSLKGKVVFITGASSGIGETTALALAEHGVKLVLAARRKDELERVKTQCLAKSKGQLTSNDILVLPMDVLKLEFHQKYFDDALRHFGQIDILMNNAGRSQRAHWENIELSIDKSLFDLNVFGVINFSRIAVKYFQARKEGHIAVTSSVAGVIGAPFSASYTGSKHALHGYFNCLRNEKMMDNLTVTIFCPGPTFTNFLSQCFTETPDQVYGKSTQPTDKRMSGERCGQLCAISLANKLDESWMGVLPLMPLLYIAVYCPIIYKLLLKIVGPQKLYKLRDSKDDVEIPPPETTTIINN